MNHILGRIRKEILEILPAFVFFLFMFHVLFITRSLTLKEYGIATHPHAMVLIGALVVSKAIFIADKFPFLNGYPRRPLILDVLFKTVTFGVLTFLFLYIEELFHQAHKHGSFLAAFEHLPTDVAWPVFWSGEIWVMVLLLFYCAGVELARAIGLKRTREIFFAKTR